MKEQLENEVKEFRKDLIDVLAGFNRVHISIDGVGQVLSNGEGISTYELVRREALMKKWLNNSHNLLLRIEQEIERAGENDK